MSDKSPSQQIDDIIDQYGGWKGDAIKQLRAIITAADPTIIEEIKWKMATRPEGLPVWTHDGIVCCQRPRSCGDRIEYKSIIFIPKGKAECHHPTPP